MAETMVSTSTLWLRPSMGTGLRRPDSSGSPGIMGWNSMVSGLPGWMIIWLLRKSKLMSSSMAPLSSWRLAGISSSWRL